MIARTPPEASRGDILALRRVGLSNAEILDLANAVAMFAWANRLMLTLGEAKAPAAAND